MARKIGQDTGAAAQAGTFETQVGNGGELHQLPGGDSPVLTTQQGVPVADDQNSLRVGERGPTLLDDFHLREKLFHFDHERIPERVVHARGFGVHGTFTLTESLEEFTTAKILTEVGETTPMFVRFSTVAGNKGSFDLARGLSGFPCVAGHNGQQGVPLCHDAKNLPYRMSFSISFWRAALPVPPSSRAVCSIR